MGEADRGTNGRSGPGQSLESFMLFGYAKFRSRSHDAVIRVYDEAGNVIIETHEQAGEFKGVVSVTLRPKSPLAEWWFTSTDNWRGVADGVRS
jgi:hypothetical protein